MEILKSIWHPTEIWAILKFSKETRGKGGYLGQKEALAIAVDRQDTRLSCYFYLVKTSRSFAAVVQALDKELRDPICIFYLVLRGLDTVEDDMSIPLDKKVPLLQSFHEKLFEKGWQFHENGPEEKDKDLLKDFDVVISEFLKLKDSYKEVIADICKLMGNGMADFANAKKVGTKKDWDLYCHYVAGLVGIGLCRMFAASGLEDPLIASKTDLANSMGLFLQKVNIIRDYLEDFNDGRTFWPEEIWSKYASSLGDFVKPESKQYALHCLNHLIADTLVLIPDCLEFMSMLRNHSVFKFCAIPQVMAIATLAECFDNHNVFKKNVKIRKGLALKLMLGTDNIKQVRQTFHKFCTQISTRNKASDPNALEISLALSHVDRILSNSQ